MGSRFSLRRGWRSGSYQPGSEGFSLTSEQLEAARAERMRLNGPGTLSLEDARTWIEETGLCLFLPRRQFSTSIAPSFVEAIAGRRDAVPDSRQIAAAEELLVRLETDGVAVRLNLLGQPDEQPDFVVASWVLPYVYALRGDRDWRRNPQLTGSRAVSQLAVQAYKLLEANDSSISHLKQALGREVSEAAVLRAITELWQQLRIIPVLAAAGQPAKWQLLRHRYQKAIAEGASTSQVTAISVLASIYLQAVIAASMEEVEIFLAPLTARSKVREVLRGLVATRQVHTISMGHAPHFYVAGTLPEFTTIPTLYASSNIPASGYYMRSPDHDEAFVAPPVLRQPAFPSSNSFDPPRSHEAQGSQAPRTPVRQSSTTGKPAPSRPHFSRPASHNRDRKPASANRPGQSANGSRIARRGADSRTSPSRTANGSRPAQGARWSQSTAKGTNGRNHANHSSPTSSNGNHSNGSAVRSNGNGNGSRNGKSSTPAWSKHNGHVKALKTAGQPASVKHKANLSRKDSRTTARSTRVDRKPALAAGAKAGNSTKRFGFTARPAKGTRKRG
jgi:23S rRNA pseudouridine2605 synthase